MLGYVVFILFLFELVGFFTDFFYRFSLFSKRRVMIMLSLWMGRLLV